MRASGPHFCFLASLLRRPERGQVPDVGLDARKGCEREANSGRVDKVYTAAIDRGDRP